MPVTVLSRCQKFELRRVEPETLATHLAGICERETVAVSPDALALIARAADGSVRDALSLLDQAIATAEGPVEAGLVQSMLGLGDRVQLLDLFDTVMRGDAAGALERFAGLYALGADPVAVAQDLLEISHWLSRLKVLPDATSSLGIAGAPTARAAAMATDLPLPVLARAWQMLLKGIDEIRTAPDAAAAAEMLLLRLACVSDLPSPAELARLLRDERDGSGRRGPDADRGTRAARRPPTAGRPSRAAGGRQAGRGPSTRLRSLRGTEPADLPGLVERLREGGEAPLGGMAVQERPSDPFRAGPAGAALRRGRADGRRRPARRSGVPGDRAALDRRRRQRRGRADAGGPGVGRQGGATGRVGGRPRAAAGLGRLSGAALVDVRRRRE